jgi:uncharacterized membrane-anchored protein
VGVGNPLELTYLNPALQETCKEFALTTAEPRSHFHQPLAAKVPEITLLFWVIKIITTGMGEAASDFMGSVSIALSASVGILGLSLALYIQFRTRRYTAPVYWFAVSMLAILGTGVADGLHGPFHIPFIGTTLIWAVILGTVLYLWRRSENTLSIHSVVTVRRETYYWLTVFSTFALGTAAGDLTATTFHLGVFSSGLMFTGAILIPLIGWRYFHLNSVFAFWFAYILTRPIGASFADWLGHSHSGGGLNSGNGPVAAVSIIVIILLVGYVTITNSGIQADEAARSSPVAAG